MFCFYKVSIKQVLKLMAFHCYLTVVYVTQIEQQQTCMAISTPCSKPSKDLSSSIAFSAEVSTDKKKLN